MACEGFIYSKECDFMLMNFETIEMLKDSFLQI